LSKQTTNEDDKIIELVDILPHWQMMEFIILFMYILDAYV